MSGYLPFGDMSVKSIKGNQPRAKCRYDSSTNENGREGQRKKRATERPRL